ncbi:MAG: type II toxin-antitoxin system RelE/ParE family toxin [Verrucomicrobia bacterium]|nr:type II toxin-antitoxin system RelE/ParE family toxin [Verrucomicrobiota bacterium]
MQKTDVVHSSEFRIFETEEFRKALSKLGSPRFLPKKLDTYVFPQLRRGPHYGPNIRKLQGYEPPTWRYRIGPYRLFYAVNDEKRIVFILTIDDRKDTYR